jgi:hypothetical protein
MNVKTKNPSHHVYLKTGKGKKTNFKHVGYLYPHEDGQGYRQTLSFPNWHLDLIIREIPDRSPPNMAVMINPNG